MDSKILNALAVCPLFHGLDERVIDQVMSKVNYHVVHFDRNGVYALEGDRCRNVDIIVQGILNTRMTSFSGKYVEVTQLRKGNIVAPAFIFAHENYFPVSVDAETDVDILRMIPDQFKLLVNHSEQVRWNFIALLSNTNHFLTNKVRFFSLLSAKEMTATMLLDEAEHQGSLKIVLNKSRQELADSFGIQKLSVIRALNTLKEEGAIDIEGRNITILNKSKLR